jgi:hypothetical protein
MIIDRACGIAPDGTRVEKIQPVSGMPPRGIPGAKDHSPRYGMGASPFSFATQKTLVDVLV